MRASLARGASLVLLAGCSACSEHAESTLRVTAPVVSEQVIWHPLPLPTQAVSRTAPAFAFDSARNQHVIFGGRRVDENGASLDDTWLLSMTKAPNTVDGYAHRGDVMAVFDVSRSRTVVFGGSGPDVRFPLRKAYFADTWEFDGARWARSITRAEPTKRSDNGLAYDTEQHLTVLFGGLLGSDWAGDVWQYDGTNWQEACASSDCSGSPRPTGRANPVFVYDPARHACVLFGGAANGRAYDDTWTWDGAKWAQLDPEHVPSARTSAAATYDPVSKRILMFGGVSDGNEKNDLWAWDGGDWLLIAESSRPVARQGARLSWDTGRRAAVLFAGSARSTATDAWLLQLTGNACSNDDECHVGDCADGLCRDTGGSGTVPIENGGAAAAPVGSGQAGAHDTQPTTPNGSSTRSLYSCAVARPSSQAWPLGALLLLPLAAGQRRRWARKRRPPR